MGVQKRRLFINTLGLRIFGIDFRYVETSNCNVSTKDLGLN
ncbi:hypothetical protein COO91_02894 [Nostoc flagelliforme CCNUN1]|uniref:Uncharacterized protein n=1 Tax=Nostoc flagelliforme CCNUN1 TaxID=2038116 RepID=A0A2K8SQ87_9NOSO|nr:hypothetical protein COO91_02894 [Nostoc flagelliforme CCNUN1]